MTTAIAPITFTGTVLLAGKTATGFRVPDDVIERLGGGRQPAVHVTIDDYAYRSTVAVRSGEFKLPLSAEHRAGAGVAAGDTVEVTLALDTAPREVAVPDDLAAALAGEPEARAFFDGLSPGKRKAFVALVEGAKAAETRQRRIDKVVAKLRAGEDR